LIQIDTYRYPPICHIDALNHPPLDATYNGEKSMKSKLILALLATTLAATAHAQLKPEDAIKYRQSAYGFMEWNFVRIKMNVEGANYNKEEVIKAANAIQAVANSGMGALYVPGTDKGTGWEPTRAKAEIWTDGAKVGQAAMALNREANEMARIAATGDAAAVKAQLAKLGGTCKGCHDDFKAKR
jgi:cytochrome c556